MGKYHYVEWIHASNYELSLPALIIHKDEKNLSWVWFEPLRFGVPNSSRTFDLDLKSLPALIIIMIWTVAVWCSYLFQNIRKATRSQHFSMKGREIRLMLTRYAPCWRDTPHADKFLTGFYYGFIFSIFWLSSWQRIDRGYEPLRFQSHLVLIIINYQLDFSQEEVSTALVPVSQKKKKKCQPL
jgi:hypothetical protein